MTCSTGEQTLANGIQGLRQELLSLEKKLAQKKSFEQAVHQAEVLMRKAAADGSLTSSLPSVESFFRRARTLLRSRYTNPAFWATTENAVKLCQAMLPESKLSSFLQELADECEANRDSIPPEPAEKQFLFEGQLSNDDPATHSEGNRHTEGSAQPLNTWEQAASWVAEAVAAAREQNGNAGLPDAELEEQAIAALLQESESVQQPKRAPKAGRTAVKRLELIDPIDAQTLERLGGAGTECSICREELEIGDTAQLMPCSDAHVFHPECLKPWFKDNNSCPICRHELETDDMDYEYQKVLDKQRAEDNKGASNALSHNEFVYM